MNLCQNLPDGQQGTVFEKFVTDEWAYATTVVSRVTSPEQALKTLGVSGGGGGGGAQNSGNDGTQGKFSWRNWKEQKKANKNGGGSNQVPVGSAQPNGGGGGQSGQKTAVTAAGTANGDGNKNQNAKSQNMQGRNQRNYQRQSYANYGGSNGGGSGNEDANSGAPFKCRVEFCARKWKHYLDRCDIFPTLQMAKRWSLIKDNNLCTYCLRHSTETVCYKAQNKEGPFPCGIDGCLETHHPWLHCHSSVRGHVGLRLVVMKPAEP
jgi:hypothetical protein